MRRRLQPRDGGCGGCAHATNPKPRAGGAARTLIWPLRMVQERTLSLEASAGSRKACHDQLAIMSSITCSMSG